MAENVKIVDINGRYDTRYDAEFCSLVRIGNNCLFYLLNLYLIHS